MRLAAAGHYDCRAMTDSAGSTGPSPDARPAETYAEVEDALLSRWPESRLDPTLDRIAAFTELLGEPQRAYPVIHLTGTNGKTSTARMIETLLRCDRAAHRQVHQPAPGVDDRADRRRRRAAGRGGVRRGRSTTSRRTPTSSTPSTTTRCRSSRPWSGWRSPRSPTPRSTSRWSRWAWVEPGTRPTSPTARSRCSPRSRSTTQKYLGETPALIAREKVGIIKPGATVVTALQERRRRRADRRAGCRGGRHAGPRGRRVRGEQPGAGRRRPGAVPAGAARGVRRGVHPAVRRPTRAQNAALALAAVEAFLGGEEPLSDEVVKEAFEEVTSPGRLEVVRRSPTIVLDAAHNPHGAAAVVEALED